jgi:hypothetical protein
MSLSEETIGQAWALAQGRCECMRGECGHNDRCGNQLVKERQGFIGEGGWFIREWCSGGKDEPENCEILCPICYGGTVTTLLQTT